MKYASVCSGVEAASLAWMPLGWKAAWFSEIEPFPCAVLQERFPNVPNLGDMTKIKVENLKNGDEKMNLEKLVADRELCEQIPADDFLDTAFCWHYTEVAGFVCRTSGCQQVSGKQWMLERSTSSKIVRYRQRGEQIFPAPTLQEILEDLIKLCVTPEIFHAHKNYWTAQGETLDDNGMYKYHHGCSSNQSTAALKLWLELNKK